MDSQVSNSHFHHYLKAGDQGFILGFIIRGLKFEAQGVLTTTPFGQVKVNLALEPAALEKPSI